MSSGAIGIALRQMNLPKRPKHLPQVQALAALGQCRLIGLWDQLFDRIGQTIAQILLTRNDIADRTQYVNAQNTFIELLSMGVIPIVNENDTLSVSEIKFGDNDTLSAITAGMTQADYLFLMTDVDCLYDKNPRVNPDAKPIEVIENLSELEADVSSAGSALGTGGMSTKIVAARLATAAGVTTIITRASKPGNVYGIVKHYEAVKSIHRQSTSTIDGINESAEADADYADTIPQATPLELATASTTAPAPLHTRFVPSSQPIRDRRFWLLHGLKPHGIVYIDPGATHALTEKAGLLPAGIVDVEGVFAQQECVSLVEVPRTKPPVQLGDPATNEIGRAVVNYSAGEIRLIKGKQSTDITNMLGYADSEYVALRENIAILRTGDGISRPTTPGPPPVSPGKRASGVAGLAGYVEG